VFVGGRVVIRFVLKKATVISTNDRIERKFVGLL